MGPIELVILGGALLFVVLSLRALVRRRRRRRRREARSDHATAAQARPAEPRRYFLSYRREDSADVVGRICDRLAASLGSDAVFKDVDSIPLGVDYRRHIEEAIQRCHGVLVAIGPGWLEAADAAGRRRLDDERDAVRIEVETALRRNITVLPLLVGGATMPSEAELPASLRPLARRNGLPIRPDPDFDRDIDRLSKSLSRGKRG